MNECTASPARGFLGREHALDYFIKETSDRFFSRRVLESMMTTSEIKSTGTESAHELHDTALNFLPGKREDAIDSADTSSDHHQDEYGDLLAHSEEHVDASKPETLSAGKAGNQSSKSEVIPHEPRVQKPSNVLFLPNMSRDASEKDLAAFATKLPFPPKKTFLYMSDTAHHGFVECTTVEHASRNLEFINADNLEVQGRRVLAEYSRRRNVEDRRTYERRQHARKRSNHREESAPRRVPRRRSRSRTPPRPLSRRSPPRDRYGPREPRDEYYRREPLPPLRREPVREREAFRYPPSRYEGHASRYEPTSRYEGPPPSRHEPSSRYEGPASRYEPTSRFEALPSRHEPTSRYEGPSSRHEPTSRYDGPPPSSRPEGAPSRYDAPPASSGYRRDYEEDLAPRQSYREPAYEPGSHYPPPNRTGAYPSYTGESHYTAPARSPSPEGYASYSYQQAPASYGTSAGPISHPLLSLQTPVRPTAVGTHPPHGYQQYQYK